MKPKYKIGDQFTAKGATVEIVGMASEARLKELNYQGTEPVYEVTSVPVSDREPWLINEFHFDVGIMGTKRKRKIK